LAREVLHTLLQPHKSASMCERSNVFMLSLVNWALSSLKPPVDRVLGAQRRQDAGL